MFREVGRYWENRAWENDQNTLYEFFNKKITTIKILPQPNTTLHPVSDVHQLFCFLAFWLSFCHMSLSHILTAQFSISEK